MEHPDKKLKLDLDFLGEGAPEKSEKKHEPKEHKPDNKKPVETAAADAPMSDSAKWILGAIGVAVLIIIIAAASSGGGSSTTASDTSTVGTTNTLPPPNPSLFDDTDTTETEPTKPVKKDSYVPVADRTETAPAVQTPLEICQERNGYNATYDSATNSCGCASGYYLGETSQQCVSLTVARNQQCAAKWPGTSFLKVDPTDGKNICDCEVGTYWNNERTACYSVSTFTQSCVSSYGTGAYSTTENGKRVCDCGYGYDWNPQRNMCVTTASINAICERDVGRNSHYAGTSSGGKYDCTEPY